MCLPYRYSILHDQLAFDTCLEAYLSTVQHQTLSWISAQPTIQQLVQFCCMHTQILSINLWCGVVCCVCMSVPCTMQRRTSVACFGCRHDASQVRMPFMRKVADAKCLSWCYLWAAHAWNGMQCQLCKSVLMHQAQAICRNSACYAGLTILPKHFQSNCRLSAQENMLAVFDVGLSTSPPGSAHFCVEIFVSLKAL